MPELPEVETMCRGIAPVVGRTVVAAGRLPCRRRPIAVTPGPSAWRRWVLGQSIAAVTRLGKRVVLVLSNDYRILFEPRMTGLVLLADAPSREHLRFQLKLGPEHQPLCLQYWDRRGLGSVRLFSPQQFQQDLLSGRIGPDALAVDHAELARRFAGCRVAIKPALLNQQRLAGVGNLYASEMLFQAKISPQLPCDRLTSAQWRRLHRALRKVLEQAIAHEGSTLSDGTYRNALNQQGGYQNHHLVYDRAGRECPRCAAPIQRIVQAQRATFFCPVCQAPPPSPAKRSSKPPAKRSPKRLSVESRSKLVTKAMPGSGPTVGPAPRRGAD